ncbi:MAG TPA: TonB-dependent receptor, partial [Pyrinomonadaceae bacterium]|nr:TonB-dependent receptor [Pyrinomonadaceae bacterium]
PTLAARSAAPAGVSPFLNASPLPNGNARADGFAEAAASYANPARHDAFSFRLDERINDRLMITGRYDYAASSATERGGDFFSLNTSNALHERTQTLTASAEYTLSAQTVAELRGNFSHYSARSSYRLDNFGGAILPATTSFFTAPDVFSVFDLNGRNAALARGGESQSLQRQFQLLGAITTLRGPHALKFGADYRRLFPVIGLHPFEANVLFNGVGEALNGTASRLSLYTRATGQRPVFNNLSAYGQDEWRVSPRLTLTYGVRWELNLAPAAADSRDAFAVTQTGDLTQLALAPRGSRLWRTTWTNFAPRVGLAYQLSNASGRELILRGGFGIVSDTLNDEVGHAYGDSFPFLAGRSFFNAPFTGSWPAAFPSLNLASPVGVPFVVFDPKLKLPYTLQWNLTAERALGSAQMLSIAYVGTSGRRLLRAQTVFDPSPDFSFVRLVKNGAASNYQSLQLQFNRRMRRGLQASAAYTWSKAIDDAVQDSPARTLLQSADLRVERGPSDFDVRHTLSGLISYKLSPRLAR